MNPQTRADVYQNCFKCNYGLIPKPKREKKECEICKRPFKPNGRRKYTCCQKCSGVRVRKLAVMKSVKGGENNGKKI